jgi:peptidoglycan/xylan/chitin deacetylase (PgdA/CDA1 family)
MAHICTDVSPSDWDRNNTPADIVRATIARATDGGFVCFHDSNTSQRRTQEALPTIIEELRKQGYWFLTVQQLFNVREVKMVPGVRYVNLPPSP